MHNKTALSVVTTHTHTHTHYRISTYKIKWLHDIQLWYTCNVATMTSYIKDSRREYEIVTIHVIFAVQAQCDHMMVDSYHKVTYTKKHAFVGI